MSVPFPAARSLPRRDRDGAAAVAAVYPLDADPYAAVDGHDVAGAAVQSDAPSEADAGQGDGRGLLGAGVEGVWGRLFVVGVGAVSDGVDACLCPADVLVADAGPACDEARGGLGAGDAGGEAVRGRVEAAVVGVDGYGKSYRGEKWRDHLRVVPDVGNAGEVAADDGAERPLDCEPCGETDPEVGVPRHIFECSALTR